MALSLHHYERVKSGDYPAPGSDDDRYKAMRSRASPGVMGPWKVERFEIARDSFELMYMMRDHRGTWPGSYTRLTHSSRGVIMSDTDAELDDLRAFFEAVELATEGSRVLIHGLGLGIALQAALACDRIAHVDVVEVDADVIALVGPDFASDDRVTIIEADCYEHKWTSGTRWEIVWHDIWDTITEDNLPEMAKLKRKFGQRCDWQGCWAERECRRVR